MKTIEVVAAIICEGDRVLATQRGYGEFEGWWGRCFSFSLIFWQKKSKILIIKRKEKSYIIDS